jgi:hypothetical protein
VEALDLLLDRLHRVRDVLGAEAPAGKAARLLGGED